MRPSWDSWTLVWCRVAVWGHAPVCVHAQCANVKVPDALTEKVKAATGTPKEVLQLVASAIKGASNVYVDGGRTIRSFVDEGLVGRAIITVVPVTLGAGIALFSQKQKDMLQEVTREKMPNGFVKVTYKVK